MSKLRVKVDNNEEAQGKHNAYLKAGFKLIRTRQRNGIVKRVYKSTI